MAHASNITVLKPTGSESSLPRVRTSRPRKRHVAITGAFALLVLLPVLISAWYLYARAQDQFASTLAFSIRSEEPASGIEMIGGLAGLSGTGAKDSDVLYHYLTSQDLIARADRSLGLFTLWRGTPNDPVFSLAPGGTVEDLHHYWNRMIKIAHDPTKGIIEVTARAFSPEDAQHINAVILDLSEDMINRINNIARDDTVRYALADLTEAQANLSQARRALTNFRVAHALVDPQVETQMQMHLITDLERQYTETQVDIELLEANSRTPSTRLSQARKRETVLRRRIDSIRNKRKSAVDQGSAEVQGDYEAMTVEVGFAEQSYHAARAGLDAAVSKARRNTRFLAAHVLPTKAERALYPRRETLLGLIALTLGLLWSLGSLIALSYLDRR